MSLMFCVCCIGLLIMAFGAFLGIFGLLYEKKLFFWSGIALLILGMMATIICGVLIII